MSRFLNAVVAYRYTYSHGGDMFILNNRHISYVNTSLIWVIKYTSRNKKIRFFII